MEVRTSPDRPPTLLVIEDADDQALLVGIAARRAHPGLDVHTVTNGLEGLAYLRGLPPFEDRLRHPLPNLVILDLYMPELDGFEVLSWIRDHMKDAPFPVVVLTASVRPEDETRAIELGAASVHKKPSDLQGLADVVSEIVHRCIGRGDIIGAHIWSAG
ncbi:MAG: response regulator [Gemmatimonadales bacterium]